MRFLISAIMLLVFSAMAFAQDVAAPVQSVGDSILKLLTSAEGASVAVMLVLEFLFRLLPSQKPIGVLRMIIASGKFICGVVLKVLEFLDKVVPQNVSSKTTIKL